MEETTSGIVISVKKQWWLKVNTKLIRKGSWDGAIFPHIIKVKYVIDGKEYTKRKWLRAGMSVPSETSVVSILYCKEKPSKAKILWDPI